MDEPSEPKSTEPILNEVSIKCLYHDVVFEMKYPLSYVAGVAGSPQLHNNAIRGAAALEDQPLPTRHR